jgi:hypothetical protein
MMNTYPLPAYDATTYYGMMLITLLVALRAAWVFAAGRRSHFVGWLAGLFSLMSLTAALALLEVFARSDLHPPVLQPLLLLTLAGLVAFGLSRRGREAASRASLSALVLLQGFRMPLELLMYRAAVAGVMPYEFSFVGYNFDVLTGAGAIVLGVLMTLQRKVPRALVLAWNMWGIFCLAVIVALAIATSPNVAAFGAQAEHHSLWVLRFPYAWLPFILVSIAIFGHLMISLKLGIGSKTMRTWSASSDKN